MSVRVGESDVVTLAFVTAVTPSSLAAWPGNDNELNGEKLA